MLKKKKNEEKKPHYKINWYEDKYQSVLVWRNWLFVITIASLIGVFAVCSVLFFMLPLKSVTPFVIQIDEKSGLNKVVQSRTVKEYSANEMLIQYFAMKYISARENFDESNNTLFSTSLETVRLMSSSDVSRAYSLLLNKDNPQSPLNIYSNITRSIELISFSVLSKTEDGQSLVLAEVKVKELTSNGSPKEYISIITLSCYFEKNLELNEKERMINPLGFIVSSYEVRDSKKVPKQGE